MEGNLELLNYIHQNSEMGKDTLKELIGIIKDENYKTMLRTQYDEYKMIYDASEEKMKEFNKYAKDINAFSKASTYLMLNLKTLVDKTPSHISEMLIKGSNMGIIDITKKLNKYESAREDIVDLGNKLLKIEEENAEECKKYLH